MNDRIKQLLHRSFDDQLSERDQSALNDALADSEELRREQQRIVEMRKLMSEHHPGFKPFFATRVMQRIGELQSQPEDLLSSILWSFRVVAVAGAMAIAVILTQNVLDGRTLTLDTLLGIPQPTLEQSWELDDVIEEALQ